MRKLSINLNQLEIYEAGAILVTLLAYPSNSTSDEQRGRLHQSLCAEALRMKCAADSSWAMTPQLIKPVYALRDQKTTAKDMRTLHRLLRDRMIAAKMAIAYLKAAASELPNLPGEMARLSLNQLSELVLSESGFTEPENVESRIWRPSVPVIHLAAAILNINQQGGRSHQRDLSIGDLLFDRDTIIQIVEHACLYERMIASSGDIPIKASKLIKVRLVEESPSIN
jgi:hypothetical protein